MKCKIKDCLSFVVDNRGKTPLTTNEGFDLVEINAIVGDRKYPNYDVIKKHVSKVVFDNAFRTGHPRIGDILIPTVGTLDAIAVCDRNDTCIAQNLIALRTNENCNSDYLYYLLCHKMVRQKLLNLDIGGVQPSIKVPHLMNLEIELPSLKEQENVVEILNLLDEKIENCREINKKLEDEAFALFKSKFQSYMDDSSCVGNYIIPRRGKTLLTKNAVFGNYPIVAGGLEPAAFHNSYNTLAPVITISASGANAGYVNLWLQQVWSSDSSFIDTSITKYVFFWYCMLKVRQQEIFDTQTGSAQAHIYPQHIASLPCCNLDDIEMEKFNDLVSPMFNLVGKNKIEIDRLSTLRAALIDKLIRIEE